jgi:hypothetical protein
MEAEMSLGIDSTLRLIRAMKPGQSLTVSGDNFGRESMLKVVELCHEQGVRLTLHVSGLGIDSCLAIATAAKGDLAIDCS